jgi:hypothetical protein
MRAPDDLKHMSMLDRMRNPPIGVTPVSLQELLKIMFFKTEDITEDRSWITAPIIVATRSAHTRTTRGKKD